MEKNEIKNRPKERVQVGKLSVLQWENSKDGESFDSFSISKRVQKANADDKTKFNGQVFSLN